MMSKVGSHLLLSAAVFENVYILTAKPTVQIIRKTLSNRLTY